MQRVLTFASFALGLVACGGSSTHVDDGGTGDMTGVSGDMAQTSPDMTSGPCTAGTGTCAVVATSIFNADFTGMGTLDTVDIASKKTTLGVDATLDPDTTLKIVGGELFVLQRDSGTVRIYDPATYHVKVELPVGDTANPSGSAYPQDFHVDTAGKIWVTLSGNDAAHAVAVLDRTTPGTIQYVTIPADMADGDGKPEANKLYLCGATLWVTTQNYTYDAMTMSVTYHAGRLVPIDTATKTAGTAIELADKNPSDITPYGTDCTDVLVASASGLTTEADGTGGIERVNLTAASSASFIADTSLGGRPTYLVVNGGKAFVAEYFDPQPNGSGATYLSSVKIVSVDLGSKAVTDVTGKFGNINFLQLSGGNLYFGAGIYSDMEDPTKLARGLYVTPADGTMLTASPIDLQLTPSAIALP